MKKIDNKHIIRKLTQSKKKTDRQTNLEINRSELVHALFLQQKIQ